jgi:NAD(P)-dependent dehydrogenase (short-subunit alcohol dehydrogenase family)
MKTIVLTGGTEGMGKGLAQHHLGRGDRVVLLGGNAEKGKAILAAADEIGAGERASFIPADLSLVSENKRAIEEIKATHEVVDSLVLCARFFRSARVQTSEGYEYAFALEYLSRYLLSYGLVDLLEKADVPSIVNVSGPGQPKPDMHWDDLGLERGYSGIAGMLQAGRANDLLGVSFAANRRPSPVKYVLINPGTTATSFAGKYDPATAAHIEGMKRMGKPVAQAIAPIIDCIAAPPTEPLSAFVEGRKISVSNKSLFDKVAAARLDAVTEKLLAG